MMNDCMTYDKKTAIGIIMLEVRKEDKEIDHNIYKALENVNLHCVLGYRKDGEYKSFLDDYDK